MEWKPSPRFANVEVSNTGRVRILPHSVEVHKAKGQRAATSYLLSVTGGELTPFPKKDTGYLVVTLRNPDGDNPRQVQVFVHVLVCETFHGPAPLGKPNACHRDGNNTNNDEINLYWGSHQQNMNDKFKHGTMSKANARLTPDQVKQIRDNYVPRCKINGANAMAKRYGVHRTSIENVVRGTTFG